MYSRKAKKSLPLHAVGQEASGLFAKSVSPLTLMEAKVSTPFAKRRFLHSSMSQMDPGIMFCTRPSCSGCSKTKATRESRQSRQHSKDFKTRKLASFARLLFESESQGKPKRYSRERRGGGPGDVLQLALALENVLHGGASMTASASLRSVASLDHSTDDRRS